jgi:aspartate aminotransferase
MNRREVEALSEIARERGIVLLSDEIYDHFVYEGEMASALNESSWRDYLLYVNGFSKTFSMTGWRLGYVVADKQVISKMGTLAANTYTCANSFAQRGALAAFRAKGEVQQMVDLFKRRRDVLYTELSKIKGVNLDLPHATFYAFLDVSKVLETAGLSVKKFSIDLIEKKGVVTIPGEVFPEEVGRMFVRLSFALGEDKIREGVKRLAEFVEEKLG